MLRKQTGIWNRLRQWTHDVLDWHREVHVIGHDGCSLQGRCCYCGRRVLQDSQGNWFSVEREVT